MKAKDFINNYIMHDSIIDAVDVLDAGATIVMWIDFAFWMQKGYEEQDPETGLLKVVFYDVSEYVIPNVTKWDEISILGTHIDEKAIKFTLINDMTDAALEIKIQSNNVIIEPASAI